MNFESHTPSGGFSNGLALIIGISKYKVKRLNLPEAVARDAEDLSVLLGDKKYCGYATDRIRVYTDEDATLERLRAGLSWLAKTASARDTVVVFFSGHGFKAASEGVLCPWDFDPECPDDTGLSEQSLSRGLADIPAGRLLVVLDACHAEALATIKTIAPHLAPGLWKDTYERLSAGSGRIVIASSLEEQYSYVNPNGRNSVFTGAMLDGLKGAARIGPDNTISVFDLFSFIAETVPRLRPDQTPFCTARTTNFAISLAKARDGKSSGQAGGGCQGPTRDILRRLSEFAAEHYEKGPDEIWARAGGQVARLEEGTPRARWRSAITLLSRGGGGGEITLDTLLTEMGDDFPRNDILRALRQGLQGGPSSAHDLFKRVDDGRWRREAKEYAECLGEEARSACEKARQGDFGAALCSCARREAVSHRRIALMTAAAAFGSADACCWLAERFQIGRDVPLSTTTAEIWLRRGADLDDNRCRHLLWMHIMNEVAAPGEASDTVRRDEAHRFLVQSASCGFPVSRLELARIQLKSSQASEQRSGVQQLQDIASGTGVDPKVRNAAKLLLAREVAFGSQRILGREYAKRLLAEVQADVLATLPDQEMVRSLLARLDEL